MKTTTKKTAVKNRKPKNVLVAYHGGGYDGCFWEWNFFSFDTKGKFFNIFTSGRDGIKTEAEALVKVKLAKNNEDHSYIYDLTKKSDIDDFQKSHAVPHVVAVIKTLNSGENGSYPIPLFFVCDECEKEFTDDAEMTDWHGCGGIASTADTKLCSDCYSSGCCEECGEYDSSVKNHGGLCDTCHEDKFSEAIAHLDKQGAKFLEYNKLHNTLTEVSISDSGIDSYRSPDDMDYWLVTIDFKGAITKTFIIDGVNEQTVIDNVARHLNGDYCTAEAELLSHYCRENV